MMGVLIHYGLVVLIGILFFSTLFWDQAPLSLALALAILGVFVRTLYVEDKLERLEKGGVDQ